MKGDQEGVVVGEAELNYLQSLAEVVFRLVNQVVGD